MAVPGVDRAAAPRLPERLPPARARPRAGGAADDRAGPQLHPERLRAARERGLVVGHGLRLVGDPVRPDAVVRLAPGLRAAGVQRLARPAAGPLGLRVGAAQRRALVRRLRLPVGPRSSTGSPRRSATRPRSPTRPTPGSRRARTPAAATTRAASFTELWKSFRTWTQPVLTFTTAPQTIAAGAPSGPMSLAPAERDRRGAGGAGADRDHALLELAARPVLARPDRAVDADARLSIPQGGEHGRAVLLPRHARREQHDHRRGRGGDERDAGGDRPARARRPR